MGAVGKSRQEACRREHKRVDTTGRSWEGVGSEGARRTLGKKGGASGRTRRKRSKAKRTQEIRKDRRQRADWLRLDAGSILLVKKDFLLMELLQLTRFWMLWMSKTRGVTIHRVFQVYQDIFDHVEMQISKLERKRMQWKVDIREGPVKAKLKATSYYGKMESARGFLFGIGTCLNPYCKLNLFENGILMPVGRLSMRSHIKRSS